MRAPEYTYIYELRDPRTAKVRYVGKANDPQDRLGRHIRFRNRYDRPKNMWIRELVDLGLEPLLRVVMKVPSERWTYFERRVIQSCLDRGVQLLNQNKGGGGPLTVSQSTKD